MQGSFITPSDDLGIYDQNDLEAVSRATRLGFEAKDINQALKNAQEFFSKNKYMISRSYGNRFKAEYVLKNYATINCFMRYDHAKTA